MVIERNLVKVGNREVKKRYIGNKLIFEDLRDKTDVLSGTEIFTDKADDSVVHVDVDGKSEQETVAYSSPEGVRKENGSRTSLDIPVSWRDLSSGGKIEMTATIPYHTNNILFCRFNGKYIGYGQEGAWGRGQQGFYTASMTPAEIGQNEKSTITFTINDVMTDEGNLRTVWDGAWTKEVTYYRIKFFSNTGEVLCDLIPVTKNVTINEKTVQKTTMYDIVSREIINVGSYFNGVITPTDTYELTAVGLGKTFSPIPSPDYPSEIVSLNDFDVVSSVGRRNLSSKDGWFAGNSINPVETENGFIITRAEGLIYSDVRVGGRDLNIKEETDYTLSFKVRKLDGELLSIGGHIHPNFENNMGRFYIDGEKSPGSYSVPLFYEPLNNGEWHEVVAFLRSVKSISDTGLLYIQPNRREYLDSVVEIKDIKLEEGHLATPYTPSLEEVESDNNPLIDKINLLLDEPLRSVGDVKDRLFRDTDGLWKVERNVKQRVFEGTESFLWSGAPYIPTPLSKTIRTEVKCSHLVYNSTPNSEKGTVNWGGPSGSNKNMFFGKDTWSDLNDFKSWVVEQAQSETPLMVQYELEIPTVETLPQPLQNKLNNLHSFKDSNYIYTVFNKTDILPAHVAGNLKPTLHTTFKSKGWYDYYKKTLLK